jgi:hypothetical protein
MEKQTYISVISEDVPMHTNKRIKKTVKFFAYSLFSIQAVRVLYSCNTFPVAVTIAAGQYRVCLKTKFNTNTMRIDYLRLIKLTQRHTWYSMTNSVILLMV